jgi:hypothetical protein
LLRVKADLVARTVPYSDLRRVSNSSISDQQHPIADL